MKDSSAPSNCILCGGTFLPCIDAADFLTSRGTFSIVQCSSCGFLWTKDAPDETRIRDFYGSAYEAALHPSVARPLFRKIRMNIQSSFRARMILRKIKKRNGRILDIGCGDGDFLLAMKRKGWTVTGIELSTEKRNSLQKQSIPVLSPDEWEVFPDESFDVVTAWHSLEHLHHPLEILGRVRRVLKPQGIIVIAVPNAGSRQAKRDGPLWFGYDVPRHLWHFTPASLQSILIKTGFEVCSITGMRLDPLIIKTFITFLQKRRDWFSTILVSAIRDTLFAWRVKDAPCMLCMARLSSLKEAEA